MIIIKKIFLLIISLLIFLFLLYPLLFTIINSFLVRESGKLNFSIERYINFFEENGIFYRGILNSIIYSVTITFFSTFISCLGAFAFSFFEFKFKKVLFLTVILIMMTPLQITLIPNFIALEKLKILNTPLAVILPGIFSAFGIFLLRQYMVHFNKEIIEAAQIDGAGAFRILFNIVAPFSVNGIVAVIILVFSESWSMIEQPIMFLSDSKQMPLSIIIRQVFEISEYYIFIPSVLFMIPVLLVYILFKNRLMDGLSKYNFNS